MEGKLMNYHNIVHDDMRNGEGLRVTLFVAGCEHHCPNCQNPQTHPYDSGIEFDHSALTELWVELDKDYISGITFSGGDPLAPKNREMVYCLIKDIKSLYPNKTIWLYTGYKYEQLLFEGDFNAVQILKNCDVVVDGRYVEELRDVSLKWRGSKNQRVLDIKKCIETGHEVLYCD